MPDQGAPSRLLPRTLERKSCLEDPCDEPGLAGAVAAVDGERR